MNETYNDYEALISRLRTEGHLSSIDVPTFSGPSKHWTVADFCVDLEQVYQDALNAGAISIEVFADVVKVPDAFNYTLAVGAEKHIGLLTVVARSMKVEGKPAVLTLQYVEKNPKKPLARILVGNIEGELLFKSIGQVEANEKEEKLKAVSLKPNEPLLFSGYSCQQDGLVQTSGKLPLNMLDVNKPLLQILTGSFELAVGAMENNFETLDNVELPRSILNWLIRWASYPSPYLSQLFQDADALFQLLPGDNGESQPVYKVPQLTSDAFIDLSNSQVAVAEKYELDENFQDVKEDLSEVVGKVVNAWLEHDQADVNALTKEIELAKDRLKESKEAVEKAARELSKQKFNTSLVGIDLETELKVDRIYRIVKATFDIVKGVVELGVGIGMVVIGNPGGLAAANPIPWIKAAVNAPDTLGKKGLMIAEVLYRLPITLAEQLMTDKELLGKGFNFAKPGILDLLEAATILMKIDKPLKDIEKIGKLVSDAASVPNPVESKAAWDSFEVDAINQLQVLENDPDTTTKVRTAVLNYKTAVQQIAIYGRAFTEQQALLAQCIRKLGILKIRLGALEKKGITLETLKQKLNDKDTAIKALSDFRNNRLHDLRRSFFVSLASFQGAYFYENLVWPNLQLKIPRGVSEMKEYLLSATHQETKVKETGDFNVIKRFDDPKILEDVKNKNVAKLEIKLEDKDFSDYNQVRLIHVGVWLDGAKPLQSGTAISISIQSETSFLDRASSVRQEYIFTNQTYKSNFKYRRKGDIEADRKFEKVLPTPFSTWTLELRNPEKVDLTQLNSVTVEMSGKYAVQ